MNDTALEAAVPWASAAVDSPRGMVSISWARIRPGVDGAVELNTTVPLGATGELHVPRSAIVRESGVVVWDGSSPTPSAAAAGIVRGRDEGTFLVFDVLSGTY